MLKATERKMLTVFRKFEIPKYSLTIMWRCQILVYVSRYLSNVKYTWALVNDEKTLERVPDLSSWCLVATIMSSSSSNRSLIIFTAMINWMSRKYFVNWIIPPTVLRRKKLNYFTILINEPCNIKTYLEFKKKVLKKIPATCTTITKRIRAVLMIIRREINRDLIPQASSRNFKHFL